MKYLILIMLLCVSCQKKHDDHEDHKHEDEHAHEQEVESKEKDEHDHEHGEEENDKIGSDKAVTEVNSEGGMKLSTSVLGLLNLQFRDISESKFELQNVEIITNQKERFVLIKRNSFFYKYPVKVISKKADISQIEFPAWIKGDELVLNNLGIIELTNTFINDDAHYGHGH